jgi:hypothetical protein
VFRTIDLVHVPRKYIRRPLIFAILVRDVKLSNSVPVDGGLLSFDDREIRGSFGLVRAVGTPCDRDRPLVQQQHCSYEHLVDLRY